MRPRASIRGCSATVEALRRISAKRKNVRGVVNLCEADDLLREGTDSPGESRLRRRIAEADFPEPEVNPVLHLRGGRLQRPGLAWWARRLCLEFDGDQHCTATWPRAAGSRPPPRPPPRSAARGGAAVVVSVVLSHIGDEPRADGLIRVE